MIEILAYFISKHAAFLEAYGNFVLIPVLGLLYYADYLIRKKKWEKVQIKWSLRVIFLLINITIGSILFMINFPLKPMVTSLAKVQRSIGEHLEDFAFTTLSDNQSHTLADYQGKVLVLNFWATYCGPCLQEFPDLHKLENRYQGRVEVLALSDEEPDHIRRVIQKLDAPSQVGRYSNEKWMNLESFRPVTIILDKDGIIREYTFGRNSLEEFNKMVIKYL